jgi:two-component system response regulator FixJ
MDSETSRTRRRLANTVAVFSMAECQRTLLENLLRRSSREVRCFSTPAACLQGLWASPCDLLIIDCDGCPTDELEVLAEAGQMPLWIPTLILVEAGDIAKAVQATKMGAFGCLEKPVRDDLLLEAMELVLGRRWQGVADLKTLTKTEARVLQLILASKTTGEIADLLHRSRRTVEVHRASILRKLNVGNTVDLVRWAVATGVIGASETGLPSG